MTDALWSALFTEGFSWMLVAVVVGGLVRGFAGFGAGMIIIPAMGVFVDPVTILVALQVMDGTGTLHMVPRAFRDGEPRRVAPLLISAVCAVPIGLYALTSVDPTFFRWAIAGLIFVLLAVMVSGWRYRERLSTGATFGVGAISGFLSGFSGLGGPPVILMYLSGPYKNSVIRANIILFFFILTFVGVALLIWRDLFTWERVWLGIALTLPYLVATIIGARIFDPSREKEFRAVAYGVILASVLMSLPLWS